MRVASDIFDFIKRWREKTKDYGAEDLAHVFDHFFSAFVLYNYLYVQITEIENYGFEYDRERATKSIRKYLGSKAVADDSVIKENAGVIKELISVGTFYIRDTHWDSKRITKLNSPDEETWSKGVLEIIYQIRCNTFHGRKNFAEKQKEILIPCIRIIERLNDLVIDTIEK